MTTRPGIALLPTEVRHAFRGLIRTPAVTAFVVMILALAIGANSALFSLLDAALIRSLPFQQPERLVQISSIRLATAEVDQSSAADFNDWRRAAGSFTHLAAWREWGMALTGLGPVEDMGTVRVTANLFDALGVPPSLGRSFSPEEELAGAAPTVVIGQGFWRDRLGGDSAVLGRSLVLDGVPHTVIGVMPAGFRFPDQDEMQLWTPMAFDSIEQSRRSQRMFNVLARLAPNRTVEAAQAELAGIAAVISRDNPSSTGVWGVRLTPLTEAFRPDSHVLLLLMAAVLLVLVIACANVANLLLARASGRRRVFAIRAALGASRAQLLRLPVYESILLGMAAGGLGLGLGVWLRDGLLALNPGLIPHWHTPGLAGRTVAFTWLVSFGVTAAVGMLPALRLRHTGLAGLLNSGSDRVAGGRSSSRLRAGLMVGEVALAFLLLVGALLLVRTLYRLSLVDPGFQPDRLLTSTINPAVARYPRDDQQRDLYYAVLEGLRKVPGVVSVAAVTTLPLNPVGIDHDLPVTIAGHPVVSPELRPQADFRVTTPGYFQTLGIALQRGRDFTPRDDQTGPRVMVINQTMARQLFPGEDPLGRQVSIPGGTYEVVGIAADVHHRGLDAPPRPEMFVALPQYYVYGSMSLVLRTVSQPAEVATQLRRSVDAIDPEQPLGLIRTMDELVGDSLRGRRFNALLLALFAGTGVLIAGLGVYAVMALIVGQRQRELAIRLALGATPRGVAAVVLQQSVRLTTLGLALGLIGALATTRLLASLLYGVRPLDPWALLGAAVLLGGTALVAAWLPARQAAQTDPMAVLRTE